MLRIGKFELKHGLILGPMAGYTDSPMRRICGEVGAEYCVSEMISAKAVCFGDKKTLPLARIDAREVPCGLQIFGCDPSCMSEGTEILLERANCDAGAQLPAAIDINMGCPVGKIVNNGEGSALMAKPELIEEIVSSVKRASARFDIPVTVKIRAGWDAEHITAVEAALAAESGGAALVCVHGRTRDQFYSGSADMSVIARVKDALSIPVVANGDITDPDSAKRAISETACDGIMIARAALGDPFVFARIKSGLEGEIVRPTLPAKRAAAAIRLIRERCELMGERNAIVSSRGQLGYFVGGFPGAAALRVKINNAQKLSEIEDYFSRVR